MIKLLQALSHTSRTYCLRQAGERGTAFEAFVRKQPQFSVHASLEAMKYFDKVIENRMIGILNEGQLEFFDHL